MEVKSFDAKCLPVLYDGLPHRFQQVAKTDLHETQEGFEKGMAMLIQYNKEHDYPALDDNLIRTFLRSAKYDMKKALVKLRRYNHVRCKMADSLDNYFDIDKLRIVIEHNMVGILPYRDDGGRVIFYTQGVPWNVELCSFDYYATTLLVLSHFIQSYPITSVAGIGYIGDLEPNHINDFYVYFKALKTHYTLLYTVPLRFHKIHSIHDVALTRWLYKLLRPIFPAFLTKRVEMHGNDLESLQKFFSKEMLPDEFGGTNGPISNEFFKEEFLQFAREFKDKNQLYSRRNKFSLEDKL